MIGLYVLFALSVFCPVYTYAIYPIILKLMRGKVYKTGNDQPSVSVIIIGNKREAVEKEKHVRKCDYPRFEVLTADKVTDGAYRAKGEIFLFTDTKTKLDLKAIKEIVKPFADNRVGAVVGQQTNPDGNSMFWKYENLVKSMESKLGCVSGANESIFAVRRDCIPSVAPEVKNASFYIATSITQEGRDVVFAQDAKAFEGKSEGSNFHKHVEDAAGYWQALRLFPKMLLPRKGSFVYVSHRVMKWFVWLNLVIALITSGILAFNNAIMAAAFVLQVIGYIGIVIIGRNKGGVIGAIYYFVLLNISYLMGLFKTVGRK